MLDCTSIVQKNFAQDNYNMWYQYLMSAKLEKKNLTMLTQYRSFDLGGDPRLFLASANLDFELADNIRPALGVEYLNLNSYRSDNSKKMRNEIRPVQQLSLKTNLHRFSLSQRIRIEERFLSNPNELLVRFRYLLALRIPFSKESNKEKVYGILKNELFINAKREDVFDSDRITAGLGFILNKKLSIELAYINELAVKKSVQYGFIGFRNSFDWRKSKKTVK